MAPLKMNSTQGIPGETNFRYKLPKYITTASLSLAVFHLRQSYESLKKDINIDEYEFIAQTLARILPSLHVDICKHFAITTGLLSDHIYGCVDDDDGSDRHLENPGASETQSADIVIEEHDGDKQCIWCSNPTGNDKTLCSDCVAIPGRIRSLEIRLQQSNNESTNDPAPNSTDHVLVLDATSPSKVTIVSADKSTQCTESTDLLSLKQMVNDLTNNVHAVNSKLERLSKDKQNHESQLRSLTQAVDSIVSSATNLNINEQDNSDYHHVDMEENTPAPSHSSPSTEQNTPAPSHSSPSTEQNTPAPSQSSPSTEEQMEAYRHKHRSKFAPRDLNTPIANTAKVDVLIIGDSMTKPIVPSRLSRRRRIKCKTLPGAKIEDVFDSAFYFARDQQPDEIVIHLGTNNVAQDEKDEIVAKLISLADQNRKDLSEGDNSVHNRREQSR